MPDSANLDMSQVLALAVDMAALTAAVPVAAKASVKVAGQEMVGRMRADAPVRTGELVGDIDLIDTEDGVEAGSSVPQGFYQEFGTVNMAPRPWAFHNADRAEQDVVQSLQNIPIL